MSEQCLDYEEPIDDKKRYCDNCGFNQAAAKCAMRFERERLAVLFETADPDASELPISFSGMASWLRKGGTL